jgi:non-specific serine/threonine protein kinase
VLLPECHHAICQQPPGPRIADHQEGAAIPTYQAGFGGQLRRYRERAGFTREALAERAQLTASGIAALEHGRRRRPHPDTLRRLVEALDLSAAERAILAAALPPPRASMHGNPAPWAVLQTLPAPRTRLIGREQLVAALAALVPAHEGRLVTLTGIGGGGKTRLALAIAAELRDGFPGGITFVELAPVADPGLVPHAVATTLGVPEVAGIPLLERLVAALRPHTHLLVLDNCEHLIDACAALAERLLSACPGLRILATSREPLQIPGERQWRVPPLALPEDDDTGSLAKLAGSASVQLFVERAQAVCVDFVLTPENAAAVAHVCAGLAGIPLAIELAAAQVRVLSVTQIRDRLDDALRLLAGCNRGAPTRQQTLRAALDWSYDLLAAPERAVFHRLGVFAGTFEVTAAEAVCCADQPADVLGLLAQLVDKSLVVVEAGLEAARYRLLEPVRQYALAQLTACGELAHAQARHAGYYLAVADRAGPDLHGSEQVAWLARLELEHDNLRAALRWTVAQEDAAAGLRFAVALTPFWEGRGHLSEGRRWLATLQALPSAGAAPATLRAEALLAEGRLAEWQADLDAAALAIDACLTQARPLDNRRLVADALACLGVVRRQQDAVASSVDLLERSLALHRSANDAAGIAYVLLNLGISRRAAGDLAGGAAPLEESLARYRALGDVRLRAINCTMLAGAMLQQRDVKRAAALLREGLLDHHAVGDRACVVHSLLCHAGMATVQGRHQRAAQLLGAMTALRAALAAPHTAISQRESGRIEAAIRKQLGGTDFEAAWQAGWTLPFDEAVTLALESAPSRIAGSPEDCVITRPPEGRVSRRCTAALRSLRE